MPTWSEILRFLVDGACGAFLYAWGLRAGKKTVPTTVNVTVNGDNPAVEGLRTVVSQAVANGKPK